MPGRRQLTPSDALAAIGTTLQTRNGDTVTLRGTNLGGWMVHEGWLSPCGSPSIDRSHWQIEASSSPADTDAPHLVQVDLRERVTFNELSVDVDRGSPVDITVAASVDGAAWHAFGSATAARPGRTRVRGDFTDARFVRVELNTGAGDLAVSDLRLHVADEHNVRSVLERRFGARGASSLIDAYQDAWITDGDLDNIADLGLNLVRVPMYWEVLMRRDGVMRPDAEAFRKMDWVIEGAARRGLYVILDMHGAPGGASPWHHCGRAGSNALWSDAAARDRTVRLWTRIAERYRDAPAVAGFDLLNEPQASDGRPETAAQIATKYGLLDELYRAIRSVDAGRLVFVPLFPSLAQAEATRRFGWTNVVHEAHIFGFDHREDRAGMERFVDQSVAEIAAHQRDWGVPLFAGEFWFAAFTELAGEFTRRLDEHGISWATWTYKHKNGLDGRDAEGTDHGRNWGLVAGGPDAIPDLDHDDAATIEAAWRRYVTTAFRPNLELAAVLRRGPSRTGRVVRATTL